MKRRLLRKNPNFLPLLDVIFILIFFLMFSLVVSSNQGSLNIELPKLNHHKEKNQGDRQIIKMDTEGNVEFDNKRFSDKTELSEVLRGKNVKTVYLAAAGELEYNLVIELIGLLREAGIDKVNLVFESK